MLANLVKLGFSNASLPIKSDLTRAKKTKSRRHHIAADMFDLILKAEVHSAGIQDRDSVALVSTNLASDFPFIETFCGGGGFQGQCWCRRLLPYVKIVKRNQVGFTELPRHWVVGRAFVNTDASGP